MNEKNVVKRPQYSVDDKAWFVEHKGFDSDYPGFHRSWSSTEEAAQRHFDNLVGRGYEIIAADVVIASGYAAQYAPKVATPAASSEQPAAAPQPEVAAETQPPAPMSLADISTRAAANTEKAADEAYASGETVEVESRREANEIYSAASLNYLPDGLYVYAADDGKKTMFVVVSNSVHGRRFEVRANVHGALYTAYHMAVTGSPYGGKLVARRFGTQAQYDALVAQIAASSDAMHERMLNS